LQECKNSLNRTATKLERHMNNLINQMVTKLKTTTVSEEELRDLARLREDWDTARQCMDICSKADIHLKEKVTNIKNYAKGDAVQFMVSTDGNTLYGRNRGLGWRSRQVGGHLNDVSIQMLSRDFTRTGFRDTGSENPSSRDNTSPDPDDGVKSKPSSKFEGRYGRGRTAAEIPMSSTGPMEGRLSSSPKK